uniref:Uncharacterized protein n=1 Tax=Ixodes ricinus TaxID=34613 RepID=A0A6B0UWS4_IXORI
MKILVFNNCHSFDLWVVGARVLFTLNNAHTVCFHIPLKGVTPRSKLIIFFFFFNAESVSTPLASFFFMFSNSAFIKSILDFTSRISERRSRISLRKSLSIVSLNDFHSALISSRNSAKRRVRSFAIGWVTPYREQQHELAAATASFLNVRVFYIVNHQPAK